MTERGATERWLLTALAHSPQTEWAAVRSHDGGPTCERLSGPAERAQQSQTGQADSGTGSTLRWGRLSACPCETCLPAVARPPVTMLVTDGSELSVTIMERQQHKATILRSVSRPLTTTGTVVTTSTSGAGRV